MKAELIVAKKQRGCSYCGSIIPKGDALVEVIDWINPMQKFPDKKNICTVCLKEKVACIRILESMLKDLKVLERTEKELQSDINNNIA